MTDLTATVGADSNILPGETSGQGSSKNFPGAFNDEHVQDATSKPTKIVPLFPD